MTDTPTCAVGRSSAEQRGKETVSRLEHEQQPGAGGGSWSRCLGHMPAECFISAVKGRRLNISAPRREAGTGICSWPLSLSFFFFFHPIQPEPHTSDKSLPPKTQLCVPLFCLFLLINTPVPQCSSVAETGEGGLAPG